MAKATKANKGGAKATKAKAKALPERLESDVSDEWLAETPSRVVRLLGAIARSKRIMRQMAGRGYTKADQATGWQRLAPCVKLSGSVAAAASPTEQSRALAELDAWDEPNVAILRTSLVGDLAPVGAYIVGGIEAQKGPASVSVVEHILGRIASVAALDADARAAGIDAPLAKAAMKKLERRGYTKEERARLAALVATAKEAPDAEETDPAEEIERHNALVLLKQWYDETAAIAHEQVTRKDDLIRMGLASAEPRKKKPGPAEPTDPTQK